MDLFDLVAKIALDTSGYESGLEEAGEKTSSFAGNLKSGLEFAAKAGLAAITTVTTAASNMTSAFTDGVSNVAAYGDNIDKMSQKMGLSAEAYQEWDAIMQHSGTSIESLKSGMKTLANAVESGNDAFERLGISQEQIASMDNEQLFSATISALQNVENETERTYLAGQLLGRGATELGALLNTSAEDTEAMRQRVHELGGVMSDEAVKAAAAYQDSLQDMQTVLGSVQRNLLSEFLPAITTVMDGITGILSGEGLQGVFQAVSQAANEFVNGMMGAFRDGGLQETIQNIAQTVAELIDGIDWQVVGEKIGNFISFIIENGPTIVSIIAGIGAGFVAWNVVTTIQGVVTAIKAFQAANEEAAITQWLLNAAMNANPIGILVTAIAAVVAALVVLWNTNEGFRDAVIGAWETIADFFSSIWEGIKGRFEEYVDSVIESWNAIVDFFSGLADGIVNAFSTIGTFFQEKFDESVNNVKESWNGIIDFFSEQADGIKNAFSTIEDFFGEQFEKGAENAKSSWDTMVDYFSENWEETKNVFSNVRGFFEGIFESGKAGVEIGWGTVTSFFLTQWKEIQNVFFSVADFFKEKFTTAVDKIKGVWDTIVDFFSEIWENVKGVFTDAWDNIKNAFSDAWDSFLEIGNNIIEGIKEGISNAWDTFVEWVKGLFEGLVDTVKDILGIHSPSTVFAGMGKNMALGLGVGWNDEFSQIKKDIEGNMDFGTASMGFDFQTATVDFASSGLAQSSQTIAGGIMSAASSSGERDIVINLTADIDGNVLARAMYRYNTNETDRRGPSLVGARA